MNINQPQQLYQIWHSSRTTLPRDLLFATSSSLNAPPDEDYLPWHDTFSCCQRYQTSTTHACLSSTTHSKHYNTLYDQTDITQECVIHHTRSRCIYRGDFTRFDHHLDVYYRDFILINNKSTSDWTHTNEYSIDSQLFKLFNKTKKVDIGPQISFQVVNGKDDREGGMCYFSDDAGRKREVDKGP